MKTTKEKIAIMQAFVDGEEVEFRHDDGPWKTLPNNLDVTWAWSELYYRIKPEPEPDLNKMIDERISWQDVSAILKEIVKRLPKD